MRGHTRDCSVRNTPPRGAGYLFRLCKYVLVYLNFIYTLVRSLSALSFKWMCRPQGPWVKKSLKEVRFIFTTEQQILHFILMVHFAVSHRSGVLQTSILFQFSLTNCMWNPATDLDYLRFLSFLYERQFRCS